jgi:hypothetical protein
MLNIINLTADLIQRLWEVEELPNENTCSEFPKEGARLAGKHFVSTTARDASGQFVVSMPFLLSKEELSDTYSLTLTRLQ